MRRAISFLAAFVLCLGLMTPVSAEEFSDVPAGYIFYDAILDCVGKGIADTLTIHSGLLNPSQGRSSA